MLSVRVTFSLKLYSAFLQLGMQQELLPQILDKEQYYINVWHVYK